MKNIKYCFVVLFICYGMLVNAQQRPQPDSLTLYYRSLAKSGTDADKLKIIEGLKKMADKDEKGITRATQIAEAIRQNALADSLSEVSVKRYPKGHAAFVKYYSDLVSMNTTAAEKEKKYQELIQQFPEPAQDADITYDYARAEVAYFYAMEGNAAKCEQWVESVKSPSFQNTIISVDAPLLEAKNEFPTAERMIRKAVAIAKAGADKNSSAKENYYANVADLAYVLFKQKRYKDALIYATEAYEGSTRKSGSVKTVYAMTLTANKRGKEALPLLVEEVKAGRATAEIKNSLKAAYIQDKGSEVGYADLMSSLNADLHKEVQANVGKKMISENAPEFALADVNGNKVSLTELKGKVVILDFWATWCGPCKKSFPAMQRVVNKYKDDPNVKFLFIDTWEDIPNPAKDVKAFIAKNNYSFQVLLDDKKSNVVGMFGITGIPAKFVIDGNGKVRFKLTGFDGADDAAVEEMSTMIEMARKQG
ncbi:redoxin domain-containing protein [Mucilaginibacter sp. KACC 22773]|uniref:redoxin domain-containing protein n=1 Tax=Mucilaginibacter sp. KACC 22773 TaxID=3025671 RepID=UPI002366F5D1|nr:redoxin domain-containing protein [Mucilaginibacter sp. KACC 22773]WDF77187.1 redoxin domain-containing protein [Mucilaginibacter sp. KACC 22773]